MTRRATLKRYDTLRDLLTSLDKGDLAICEENNGDWCPDYAATSDVIETLTTLIEELREALAGPPEEPTALVMDSPRVSEEPCRDTAPPLPSGPAFIVEKPRKRR